MKVVIDRPSTSAASPLFCAQRLERVFSRCFFQQNNTRLQGGFDEPFYRPVSSGGDSNVICYREDFFASALHEVAHWCIAGAERRKLADFGYWYAPDGRTEQQQKAFEDVEYQPQALEWFFAKACGYRFAVSADNLHGAGSANGKCFEKRVVAQAEQWRRGGIAASGAVFYKALCQEFDTKLGLSALCFGLQELDLSQVSV